MGPPYFAFLFLDLILPSLSGLFASPTSQRKGFSSGLLPAIDGGPTFPRMKRLRFSRTRAPFFSLFYLIVLLFFFYPISRFFQPCVAELRPPSLIVLDRSPPSCGHVPPSFLMREFLSSGPSIGKLQLFLFLSPPNPCAMSPGPPPSRIPRAQMVQLYEGFTNPSHYNYPHPVRPFFARTLNGKFSFSMQC